MRPLWRENGSVIYCTIDSGPCQSNYTWAEVPQNSRPHLTVSSETPPTWRAMFPYLYPPGTGWPSYTPGHWVPSYDSRGLRWKYSNSPPHGAILDIIHRPVFYLKLSSTLSVCPYLTGNTLRLRYEPNRLMLSIGLWRRYINMAITILDIIHRPVFYLKLYIPYLCCCWCQEAGTVSIYWAHRSRFHLKMETESSSRNVMFLNKDRTMDAV
jgi:hypothetical protein